jgi:hypothetical protein
MTSRVIIQPKGVSETITIPFDFASELGAGETISSVTAYTATVYSGADPNPALVAASSSISGTTVNAKAVGGVAGVIYYLTVRVATTLFNSITIGGYLAVVPEPS